MSAPTTVHAPAHRPVIAPAAPAVPALGWRDLPVAAGSWAYVADAAGSSAMFGQARAEADFVMRCDTASRQVVLSLPGQAAAALAIDTSSGRASYAAAAVPAATPRIGVALAAADPMLDRIAFSRGRFAATLAGSPALVLPAWAEPIRVVEDCRK